MRKTRLINELRRDEIWCEYRRELYTNEKLVTLFTKLFFKSSISYEGNKSFVTLIAKASHPFGHRLTIEFPKHDYSSMRAIKIGMWSQVGTMTDQIHCDEKEYPRLLEAGRMVYEELCNERA